MVICKSCSKKLNAFNTPPLIHNLSADDRYCKDCFKKRKKENKNLKTKGVIKEIKCKCNQCGVVWHYLEEDEKRLKSQSVSNALMGCGMFAGCCSPFGGLFSNKSIDLQREIGKMKKCPKCNSTDVKKTTIYHEKKD